jgi:hypothetical protein
MRGSANTIKHTHMPIHFPSLKDVKGWAEKVNANERKADAALLGVTAVLFGWLFYCLAKAFENLQVLL